MWLNPILTAASRTAARTLTISSFVMIDMRLAPGCRMLICAHCSFALFFLHSLLQDSEPVIDIQGSRYPLQFEPKLDKGYCDCRLYADDHTLGVHYGRH